jgi:hypothetical protein
MIQGALLGPLNEEIVPGATAEILDEVIMDIQRVRMVSRGYRDWRPLLVIMLSMTFEGLNHCLLGQNCKFY